MNKDKNTVSLCMIVKDEEKKLAECLNSVCQYVDEIIIVDTGSRDKTIEVAQNYNTTVIKEPWNDDFSAARNKGLEYATGDWILYLDADEKLPSETAEKLDLLADNPEVTAWVFSIISPVDTDEDLVSIHPNIRMFRNHQGYYFTGKIHEQIKPVITEKTPDAIIKESNLKIIHSGYRRDLQGRKEKTIRNLKILKKELADNRDDPFINYNIGISYYMLGKLELSLKHYQIAINNIDLDSAFASVLYRNYIVCLMEAGNYKLALEVINQGLSFFSDYPDLYFLKGELFWDLGIISEAEKFFQRATQFERCPVKYTSTAGVTDYLSLENLAEISAAKADYETAIEYLNQVYLIKPAYHLLKKICNYLKMDNEPDIDKYLSNNYNLEIDQIFLLLYDSGCNNKCLNIIKQFSNENIIKCFKDKKNNERLFITIIKILIMSGNCQWAREVLNSIANSEIVSSNQNIFKLHCLCNWLSNPRLSCEEYIKKYEKEGSFSFLHKACKIINNIVINSGYDFDNEIDKKEKLPLREIREILIDIYKANDKDLALIISSIISDNKYYFLGKTLADNKLYADALSFIERSFYIERTPKVYCSAAYLSEKLNDYQKAFGYYLAANKLKPDDEYIISSILYTLSSCLVSFVAKYLHIVKNREQILNFLLKLTSFRKKIKRIRGAISHEKQD